VYSACVGAAVDGKRLADGPLHRFAAAVAPIRHFRGLLTHQCNRGRMGQQFLHPPFEIRAQHRRRPRAVIGCAGHSFEFQPLPTFYWIT